MLCLHDLASIQQQKSKLIVEAIMGRFQASDRLNLLSYSKRGWIRSPFESEAWSEPLYLSYNLLGCSDFWSQPTA